jgi:hypothetical protein
MKARLVELSSRPGKIFWYSGELYQRFHRGRVGEFEDDDPFRLRSAFDEFGGADAGQEYCVIVAPTAAR